jgi:hypothetical protein
VRSRFVLVLSGAIMGAVVSGWAWLDATQRLAAGEHEAGIGFGLSHLLFFVSLPWSILALPLGAIIALIVGPADGSVNLLVFYAMPIVAGACWGWAADRLYARIRRARS